MATPTTAERGENVPSDGARPVPSPAVRRARRRLAGLLLVAFTVLAGAGAWVVYGSSWLRVTQVAVTGTMVLTPEQVRAVAEVPTGRPVASVDTAAIERRLRDGLSRIAEVDVVRSWPHTIALNVTERTPAAVLRKGGAFIEVDAHGERFATVESAPKGAPLLELTGAESPSSRHFGTKRLLEAGVTVAARLPGPVRRAARVIRLDSYDGVTVELSGGRTVVWGSPEQGDEKAAVLTALMKASRNARRFDVSAPGAPASAGS